MDNMRVFHPAHGRTPVSFALEPKHGSVGFLHWVVCSDGAVFFRDADWGGGNWKETSPVPGTAAAVARENAAPVDPNREVAALLLRASGG